MTLIEYQLNQPYIPLIQLLKFLNLVSSGGEAKAVVENNMVTVNDKPELRKRYKVKKGDVINFNGYTITII
jgi:ribosome-associated protein